MSRGKVCHHGKCKSRNKPASVSLRQEHGYLKFTDNPPNLPSTCSFDLFPCPVSHPKKSHLYLGFVPPAPGWEEEEGRKLKRCEERRGWEGGVWMFCGLPGPGAGAQAGQLWSRNIQPKLITLCPFWAPSQWLECGPTSSLSQNVSRTPEESNRSRG